MRLQTRAFLIATGVGLLLQFGLWGLYAVGVWGLSQTSAFSTATLVSTLTMFGGAVQCCGWLLDVVVGATYPWASAPHLQVTPEAGAIGGASAAGLSRIIIGLLRTAFSLVALFAQSALLNDSALLPALLFGQVSALAIGVFTLLFSVIFAAISGSVVAAIRLRRAEAIVEEK